MRPKAVAQVLIILTIASVLIWWFTLRVEEDDLEGEVVTGNYEVVPTRPSKLESWKGQKVILAVVCCGDRLPETFIMIKSAIMLALSKIEIIIVTEEELVLNFVEKVIMINQVF
jgi:hypothetical protein